MNHTIPYPFSVMKTNHRRRKAYIRRMFPVSIHRQRASLTKTVATSSPSTPAFATASILSDHSSPSIPHRAPCQNATESTPSPTAFPCMPSYSLLDSMTTHMERRGQNILSTDAVSRTNMKRLECVFLVVCKLGVLAEPSLGEILVRPGEISRRMERSPVGHTDDGLTQSAWGC